MKLAAFLLALLLMSKPLFAAAADIVVINADVRTMDAGRPRAEAFAITGNKFTAVGTNKEIAKLAGPSTRKIDADGRLVVPGFNDAHVHFASIGNIFSTVDLRKVKTSTQLEALISSYASVLPNGRWILGGGWNGSRDNAIGLSRELVDPLTRDNPLFLFSADGSAAFANGNALKLAGIGGQTTVPAGSGIIERGAAGEPTGFLFGNAVKLVRTVVPADHTRKWPEILETASNYAASLGVTSVQDTHSDEFAEIYRELDRRGRLKTRVYDCSPLSAWARLAGAGVKAATGGAMVRTGCVKTHVPFADDEIDRLRKDIAGADKAGLQILIHAVGPEANAEALNVLGELATLNGKRDRRHRIEHSEGPAEADFGRFSRGGIVASIQPGLFFSPNRDGRYSDHLRLGTRLAFGSDAPMTGLDPLAGIYAAMSGPRPLDFDAAVRAYTLGSAYAEFQEQIKGTIKAGSLADIVVLSNNIQAAGPQQIRNLKVWKTLVNGKIVYEADQ